MTGSRVPVKDPVFGLGRGAGARSARPVVAGLRSRVGVSRFWRHFLEMFAAMAVGMMATAAIFVSAVGVKTWDQVTLQYPAQALLAMAAGMTIPMVAWMLVRGMGRRNSAEMAAAMVLPVTPFLCLVWFHVTTSAWCGPYCASAILAMLGLMCCRRGAYLQRDGAGYRRRRAGDAEPSGSRASWGNGKEAPR